MGRKPTNWKKNKKLSLREKIILGLDSMKSLNDCMTYEEFGIYIGYIPRKLNAILRGQLADDLAANMRRLRADDDRGRYECEYVAQRDMVCVVPYRLSQSLTENRLTVRTKQELGQRRSVYRSLDLLEIEAKVNPDYNRREAKSVANNLRAVLSSSNTE